MTRNIFKVSHSKIKLWLKCRRAYWYRYVEKLKRKFVPRPLMFGRLVHKMSEYRSNGDDPQEVLREAEKSLGKTFRVLREEYGEILDDTRVIMNDYFDYWDEKGDVSYIRMKGKSGEYTFEVEIAPGIILVGVIDKFARSNRLRWLVEHKTGKNFPNEDHRWRNLQSALYIEVVDRLKLPPVDGTMWDYIKSKPPAIPKILKSGKMSQRGIDSLPTRVKEVLEREGLKPRNFPALMKSAMDNRRNYFQRIFMPVKAGVVKNLFNQTVEVAKEMADSHGKSKTMTIERHCDWCEFEPLCRAELQGLDTKFVKSKDYEERKPHEEIDADFEG